MANLSDDVQDNISEDCFKCNQTIDDGSQTSVQCNSCCQWAHTKCAVHKDVFGLLQKINKDKKKMVMTGDLMFLCDPCLKEVNDFFSVKNSPASTTANVNVESSTSDQVVQTQSKATSTDNVPTPVSTDKGSSDKQNANLVREKKICSFYARGTCRHGSSGKAAGMNGKVCNFSHPKKCPRFCKYGYDEQRGCNRSCNLFHPFLCNSSSRYGYCYKNNCTYQHLHGTVRIADPNKFPGRQVSFNNHVQPPKPFNGYQYSSAEFPSLQLPNNFLNNHVQPQNSMVAPNGYSNNVSDPLTQLTDAIKDLKSQNISIRDELNSMKSSMHGTRTNIGQYNPPFQNNFQERNPKNFPSQTDGVRN